MYSPRSRRARQGESQLITATPQLRRHSTAVDEDIYLLMATRRGMVKKTLLSAYARPKLGGIIGIALDEGDALIGVAVTRPGDEIVLCTRSGMAIRFGE